MLQNAIGLWGGETLIRTCKKIENDTIHYFPSFLLLSGIHPY